MHTYVDIGPKNLDTISIFFKTNRLIHREALDVFYVESLFMYVYNCGRFSLFPFPRIIDTIRIIYLQINICALGHDINRLYVLKNYFGNSTVIRDTLAIYFTLDDTYRGPNIGYVEVLICDLRQFIGFRTVEVYFPTRFPDRISEFLAYVKNVLRTALGDADFSNECKGLRFNPVDHQSFSREPKDDDSEFQFPWLGSQMVIQNFRFLD